MLQNTGTKSPHARAGQRFFGALWNGMMFDSLGSAAQKILSDRRFDVFFLKMFDFLRYVLSGNMKETDA